MVWGLGLGFRVLGFRFPGVEDLELRVWGILSSGFGGCQVQCS